MNPGSPAEKSGLKPQDVVTSVAGKPVTNSAKLRNIIAASGANATVKLELIREGKALTLDVTLGELDAGETKPGEAPGQPDQLGGMKLGALDRAIRQKLELPDRVKHGAVVLGVDREGPAGRAGIRPGDVIVEMEREAIKGPADAKRIYEGTEGQVLLRIVRGGGSLFVVIKK